MDFDFDFDEEWIVALCMGLACAFVVLLMFKFGRVPVSIGIKILGMIGGLVLGTVVSKFIFSR